MNELSALRFLFVLWIVTGMMACDDRGAPMEVGTEGKRSREGEAPDGPNRHNSQAATDDRPSADDAADARAILDRALRAHSDDRPDRLDRMARMVQHMEGEMLSPSGPIPATGEIKAVWPDHYRINNELRLLGSTGMSILVLQGENGWRSVGEGIIPMNSSQSDELLAEAHAAWLATPHSWKVIDGTLSTVDDEDVNRERAVGVSVKQDNRPEVELFFHADSGLLVKLRFEAKEAGLWVVKEWTFAEHQEFDGIQLPTKLTVHYDGRKMATWTITDYEFPAEIDAEVFEKP